MFNSAAKSACRVIFVSAMSSVAMAQSPTQTPPSPPQPPPAQSTPSPTTAKPTTNENEAVRIRGLVETVDAAGVIVKLSQGISIRVDIDSLAPVFVATRLALADVKVGDNVGVRTRAALSAGDNVNATEVITMPEAQALRAMAMSISGTFKSFDKGGERPVLTLTEGSAERKVTVTNETTFWSLRPASVVDVKPGVSISILVVRDAGGSARTQRIVFGMPPAGSALPL